MKNLKFVSLILNSFEDYDSYLFKEFKIKTDFKKFYAMLNNGSRIKLAAMDIKTIDGYSELYEKMVNYIIGKECKKKNKKAINIVFRKKTIGRECGCSIEVNNNTYYLKAIGENLMLIMKNLFPKVFILKETYFFKIDDKIKIVSPERKKKKEQFFQITKKIEDLEDNYQVEFERKENIYIYNIFESCTKNFVKNLKNNFAIIDMMFYCFCYNLTDIQLHTDNILFLKNGEIKILDPLFDSYYVHSEKSFFEKINFYYGNSKIKSDDKYNQRTRFTFIDESYFYGKNKTLRNLFFLFTMLIEIESQNVSLLSCDKEWEKDVKEFNKKTEAYNNYSELKNCIIEKVNRINRYMNLVTTSTKKNSIFNEKCIIYNKTTEDKNIKADKYSDSMVNLACRANLAIEEKINNINNLNAKIETRNKFFEEINGEYGENIKRYFLKYNKLCLTGDFMETEEAKFNILAAEFLEDIEEEDFNRYLIKLISKQEEKNIKNIKLFLSEILEYLSQNNGEYLLEKFFLLMMERNSLQNIVNFKLAATGNVKNVDNFTLEASYRNIKEKFTIDDFEGGNSRQNIIDGVLNYLSFIEVKYVGKKNRLTVRKIKAIFQNRENAGNVSNLLRKIITILGR